MGHKEWLTGSDMDSREAAYRLLLVFFAQSNSLLTLPNTMALQGDRISLQQQGQIDAIAGRYGLDGDVVCPDLGVRATWAIDR